jgi:UDP-N-acetylglucosamine 2-epimerase (non-hydrolysing)
VTAHRAENVDVPERLFGIVSALNRLAADYDRQVVWSVHPRTRERIQASGFEVNRRILLSAPFDLFDFVRLEKSAFCVLTDSGTVQEECCIFGVPAVTVRDTTERPETVECGSTMLAGCDADRILEAVKLMTETCFDWDMPEGYVDPNVSDKVIRHLLGNVGRRPLLDR